MKKYSMDNSEINIVMEKFINDVCIIDYSNKKVFTTTENILDAFRDYIDYKNISTRKILSILR